jgi:hypothetical protein
MESDIGDVAYHAQVNVKLCEVTWHSAASSRSLSYEPASKSNLLLHATPPPSQTPTSPQLLSGVTCPILLHLLTIRCTRPTHPKGLQPAALHMLRLLTTLFYPPAAAHQVKPTNFVILQAVQVLLLLVL